MITRRAALCTLVVVASGTGSCANAADAPAQAVSVRDPRFAGGARGDGRNDDTKAFQAAIDAAASIFVPPGNYVIEAPLRVPSNRHIFGNGVDSILCKPSEDMTALLVNADPAGNSGIVLEHLVFDGGRRTDAYVAFRDGIHLTRCTNCLLKDVVVRNCLNDGIIIEYGARNRIEHCTVSGNAKDGIYLSGSTDAYVSSNRATGNLVGGIAIAATQGAVVTDSTCFGNRADILLGRDASDVEVSKNDCRSDTAFAISPEPLPGQTLHGKRYPDRDEPGWGIVYGASHCRIVDNRFAGQVRLILLEDSEFARNVCVGSRAQGVVLQGASRNRITANTIRDWGRGYGGIQVAALTANDGVPRAQDPPIASIDNILRDNRIVGVPGKPVLLDAGLRTVSRTVR